MTDAEKAELKRKFDEDGYALIPRLFDKNEVAALVAEVSSAPTNLEQSTLNQTGLLFREHMIPNSAFLRSTLTSPKVLEIMTSIIEPDLWIRRDTAIIKRAGGEEFHWHQDNGYNKLLDPYVQFWIALTPMFDENGGVWLIPGSHKNGLLPHHMEGTHFVWDGKPQGQIPITAEAGDVLVFSSYLLHRTGPNKTKDSRIAYLSEFISRKYFDPYSKPPFFMVSKNGAPDPRFTRFYEGNTSLWNYLKYIGPRTTRRYWILRGQLKRTLLEAVHYRGE